MGSGNALPRCCYQFHDSHSSNPLNQIPISLWKSWFRWAYLVFPKRVKSPLPIHTFTHTRTHRRAHKPKQKVELSHHSSIIIMGSVSHSLYRAISIKWDSSIRPLGMNVSKLTKAYHHDHWRCPLSQNTLRQRIQSWCETIIQNHKICKTNSQTVWYFRIYIRIPSNYPIFATTIASYCICLSRVLNNHSNYPFALNWCK